jgi:tetratricopeptide (TPR) repeat protein
MRWLIGCLLLCALGAGSARASQDVVVPPAEEGQRDNRVDELLSQLQEGAGLDSQEIENELKSIWSDAPSAAGDFLMVRVDKAMRAEDFQVAERLASELIRIEPHFAGAYTARAETYFAQDEPGLAAEDLASALALEPRHIFALLKLGRAMRALNAPAAAYAAYAEALRLHPESAEAQTWERRLRSEGRGERI